MILTKAVSNKSFFYAEINPEIYRSLGFNAQQSLIYVQIKISNQDVFLVFTGLSIGSTTDYTCGSLSHKLLTQ